MGEAMDRRRQPSPGLDLMERSQRYARDPGTRARPWDLLTQPGEQLRQDFDVLLQGGA